jgi:hypothetical protein
MSTPLRARELGRLAGRHRQYHSVHMLTFYSAKVSLLDMQRNFQKYFRNLLAVPPLAWKLGKTVRASGFRYGLGEPS